MNTERKTIDQICTALGLVPDKHAMWSIGAEMCELHWQMYGTRPDIDLHRKTWGDGTQDKAEYSSEWWPVIKQKLLERNLAKARQLELKLPAPIDWDSIEIPIL